MFRASGFRGRRVATRVQIICSTTSSSFFGVFWDDYHYHQASFRPNVVNKHQLINSDGQRAVAAARGPARQDAWVYPGSTGTRRARSATPALGAASRRGCDGALWARRRRATDARQCVVGGCALSDEAGPPRRHDIEHVHAGRVIRPSADERTGARAPPRGTFPLLPHLFPCCFFFSTPTVPGPRFARDVVERPAARSVSRSCARCARRGSGVLDC